MITYTAEYWYRYADDPDQSQRDICQMSGPARDGERSVLAEIAALEAQDYIVQQAILLTTCEACQGAGRIGVAPKGTRAAKRAGVPAWRKTWRTCEACAGVGSTNSATVHSTVVK